MYDEHFHSLKTRFYKVIYIYNRLFTPLGVTKVM